MPRPRGISSELGIGFRRPSYRYVLAPWTWDTSQTGRSFWRLPTSAVGGVDLRPLPAQGIAGGSPQGFAFCAALQSPGGTIIATALHMSETPATAGMRSAWQSAMGYTPQGATLTDLLWDQLTAGSDPSGDSGPKPLVPGTDGQLKLYVSGHSLVKSERFEFGVHPHTNRLRDLLRREFEEQWERTNGDDHCRRCLDFTCKKYRVNDWKEFVPPRLHAHVPGRLPHATTITESFNQADSSTLGPDLTWGEVGANWATVSNQAAKTELVDNQGHYARAESDLSSDDHYSQAALYYPVATTYHGPACRVAGGSTVTFYSWATASEDANGYLIKFVTGTQTNLVNNAVGSRVDGTLAKIEVDGSALKGYYGGVEKSSTTDTAITGNLRCGLNQFRGSSTGAFDSFEAADLAAGGRTTKNTRSWPLGVNVGMGWRMPV